MEPITISQRVCSIQCRFSMGKSFRNKSYFLSHSNLASSKLSNFHRASVKPVVVAAKKLDSETDSKIENVVEETENDEEYEEETWLEEKLGDVYEVTVGALEVVPGPRVGGSGIPWLVAVPATYIGVSFVWAIVRLVLKYNSPKSKRKRQVGKNALLSMTLEEYFPARREELTPAVLATIRIKFKFSSYEILRKYTQYALNERPFGIDVIADLIHLKKAGQLTDDQVAEALNDYSKRVVKSKGPIVMNTEGMTEKGIKRKATVQAIFSKLYYLSEVEDFISSEARGIVQLKEIFGITDEDADTIKIVTLNDTGDLSSLERLMGDGGESDGSEGEN